MGIGSGVVLNAKNLYAFVRNIKTPSPGDLREPVTFYHSSRLPTVGPNGSVTDQMDENITPYQDAWAYVWQSQVSTLDGQNVQNQVSHVFLVRNFPGFVPEVKDGIVWDGKIHMVRGTRNLENDPRGAYLIVLAEQEGLYREELRNNTLTPEDALSEYTNQIDPKNPIWL
jgi:hypothetical protein